MRNDPLKNILTRLELEPVGRYDNRFYIIEIENSDEYAKIYTKLEKNAINTEFPSFGSNSNKATVKITNYFELELNNEKYLLFLIADFQTGEYYLKIGGL